MNRLIGGAVLFSFWISPIFADSLPRFEEYPATEAWDGVPVSPVLDRALRHFRTIIRREVAKGPNFAGAYTIVSWGCGTECEVSVLVDDRSGQCFMIGASTFGLDFRKDSRLLIKNPGVTSASKAIYGEINTEYYLWNGVTFDLIDGAT